jgi:outer membrane protein OmpA-like peptidoglycan-associated protein
MRLVLLILIFSFSSFAHNHEGYNYKGRFGIGGGAGYSFPVFGNVFNEIADSDGMFSFHGRYHLCEKIGLEASFNRHEFADTNITATTYEVLAFRRVNPISRFTPVYGVGLSAVDLSNYTPDSMKLGVKLRAGIEYSITYNLVASMNLDYLHINKMLFDDNLPTRNAHVLSPKLQLTWYFGQGGESHQDHAPTQVADKDSDNDGVMDSKDKCPNTKAGIKVNAYGCAAEEKAHMEVEIEFMSGKADIAAKYDNEILSLAKFMQEHPKTVVEIQGHTDSSGSKAINKTLSQKRADSVKNVLINKYQIDAKRLSSKGYGDEQPVADNKTVEGKQKNRRVMAVVDEK